VSLADERMSVEHQWNDSDRGKTEVHGEKPVSVPLCTPQISHGLTGDWTWTPVWGTSK